jgi:hypothetical protein
MPYKSIDWLSAFAYVMAGVTGMGGGCAVIAHRIMHGQVADRIAFVSYAIIGLFSGSVFYAFLDLRGWIYPDPVSAVVYGGGGGLFVTLLVAGMNFGSRLILRFRGFEAEVTFRRTDQDKPK